MARHCDRHKPGGNIGRSGQPRQVVREDRHVVAASWLRRGLCGDVSLRRPAAPDFPQGARRTRTQPPAQGGFATRELSGDPYQEPSGIRTRAMPLLRAGVEQAGRLAAQRVEMQLL